MLRSWLVVTTLVALTCAACGGNSPGDSTSDPTTPAASSSPSPTIPSYLATYSPDERAAYDDAVLAYEAFTAQDARILAKGETTKRASDFYHRYSIDWVTDWANLTRLANLNVKVTGQTSVRSTTPVSITLGGESDVVVLRQCLDKSNLVVTQDGKQLEQPQFKEPYVFRVRVEKRGDEGWWRTGIAKQGARC